MEPTPSLLSLLQHFGPVFTTPTFTTFVQIVTGWAFSQRHLFITEIIFSGGNISNGHWSRFHRFFSHAAWDLDTFALVLAKLVVSLLASGATLLWAVDDTLCRRRGLTLYGAGMHHDPLISSRAKPLVSWGHDWVVLGLLIVHPFWAPTKVFTLPVAARSRPPVAGFAAEGARHRGQPSTGRARPSTPRLRPTALRAFPTPPDLGVSDRLHGLLPNCQPGSSTCTSWTVRFPRRQRSGEGTRVGIRNGAAPGDPEDRPDPNSVRHGPKMRGPFLGEPMVAAALGSHLPDAGVETPAWLQVSSRDGSRSAPVALVGASHEGFDSARPPCRGRTGPAWRWRGYRWADG